jgi:hypothetical protein
MSTPPIDIATLPAAAPEPVPPDAAATTTRPRAPASLVVLAVLAVGYTLWATQDLILPVLLAMFFALVGNPIIRVLQRIRIPRFLAALAVLCSGLALAILLGQQLVQPAANGSARPRASCAAWRRSCRSWPSRCRTRTRPPRTSPAPPAARTRRGRCRWSGPRSTTPIAC